MDKIIVTGGLGFIGSNLIELLLLKNYYVINLDKVTYSSNFYNTKEFLKNKNYKFIKCDINNKRIKRSYFRFEVNNQINQKKHNDSKKIVLRSVQGGGGVAGAVHSPWALPWDLRWSLSWALVGPCITPYLVGGELPPPNNVCLHS
jgi:hypothetical protein